MLNEEQQVQEEIENIKPCYLSGSTVDYDFKFSMLDGKVSVRLYYSVRRKSDWVVNFNKVAFMIGAAYYKTDCCSF